MTTAEAYAECRRIARASGSSFYAGMRLLPPEPRAALFAVYALAREIDDIADGSLPTEEKLGQLASLREELEHIGDSNAPVLVAVSDAVSRYPIPLAAFGDLIDGAEMDARGRTYADFAELEVYCRCVAGSIGRLSLGVFATSDRPTAVKLADDLGVALQLTNIVRDVMEDRRQGRTYLPAEDVARFDGDLELILAFESERALGWLERGLKLVPLLDRRSAACVSAMAGSYRRLLLRIASQPELPLRGRVSLRSWEKGYVLARSLVGVM